MKKIIIGKNKCDILLSEILNESLSDGDQSDKVLQIKNYLDANFAKASGGGNSFDANGERTRQSFVALLDDAKNVLKLLSDKQVFDLLQERFKSILPNSNESERNKRDEFLKKVLIAWYNNNITKQGSIVVH